MTSPPDDDLAAERERVADRLRRVRDEVRERALLDGAKRQVLPPPLEPAAPEPAPSRPIPQSPPPPERPDGGPVNSLWQAGPSRQWAGLKGRVSRFLRALLDPWFEAQVRFNSKQVQLDNQVLEYIDVRFEATHRHYDAVLGHHGRHLADVDERHMILQEELVAHVHDLVKRIDLVLSEAERGRMGLEFALRDLRARAERLEEQLKRG